MKQKVEIREPWNILISLCALFGWFQKERFLWVFHELELLPAWTKELKSFKYSVQCKHRIFRYSGRWELSQRATWWSYALSFCYWHVNWVEQRRKSMHIWANQCRTGCQISCNWSEHVTLILLRGGGPWMVFMLQIHNSASLVHQYILSDTDNLIFLNVISC